MKLLFDTPVSLQFASCPESYTVNVAELTFSDVTAPSVIAAVVTELAGNGAFNKSPLVIFFVVDADTSTIAISSELSAAVSDCSWLIRGKVILLFNGVSNDILIIAIQVDLLARL